MYRLLLFILSRPACVTLFAVSIAQVCGGPAFAYSEGGHKLVASIAFRQLTPDQRAKVVSILEHHPRFAQDFRDKMPLAISNGSLEGRQEWLFQQAAIWPDLVKFLEQRDRDNFSRPLWHFINRPLFLRSEDERELSDSIDVNLNAEPPSSSIDVKSMNVVQAIVNSSRVLAADGQQVAIKAVHICWLLHTIGDLHQPLHSAALFSRRLFPHGDRGGNAIKTTVNDNLHSVWDLTFGQGTTMEQARNRAIELLATPDLAVEAQAAAMDLSPISMWNEGFNAAIQHVYSREVLELLRNLETQSGTLTDNPLVLSQNYLQNRKAVCEPLVIRAGARCAAYLAALTVDRPSHSLALAEVRRLDPSRSPANAIAGHSADSVEQRLAVLTRRIDELSRRPSISIAQEATVGAVNPVTVAASANPKPVFASFDPQFPPPIGITPFALSQEYPTTYDLNEKFPWMEIDFRTHGVSYLQAVLEYCLEGNKQVDFRGQENSTRRWYHAPWMHEDGGEGAARAGREYHHGLTSERRSRPKELHPLQTGDGFPGNRIPNWAVSLYSPRGGYTLGRVWHTVDGRPDPYRASFPDNSVSFKLLFTTAPVEQVPFLNGSFSWTANINPKVLVEPFTRVDQTVRLLQVDVAVKDPRVAIATGWIFGTFVYDGSRPGDDPFKKLVPVGLSYEDDAEERRMLDKDGAFINPFLRSTVINQELLEPPVGVDWGNRGFVRHHGLGGRLNGPVDNPSSSCISCHGRAATAVSKAGFHMPIINKTGSVTDQIEAFDSMFRTIRPGAQLVRGNDPAVGEIDYITVDYSLQVSMGIRNYYKANPQPEPSSILELNNFTSPASSRRHPPQVSRGEH